MREHTGKKAPSKFSPALEKGEAGHPQKTDGKETSIPAIRHVGPTLESDRRYLDQTRPVRSTPEAEIAQQAGTAEPAIREIKTAEVDPLTGEVRRIDEPEPLKTRLPGDTSSDPHTDVGTDNATTVQHRGEPTRNRGGRKRRAA
jgi:hypothetical protein